MPSSRPPSAEFPALFLGSASGPGEVPNQEGPQALPRDPLRSSSKGSSHMRSAEHSKLTFIHSLGFQTHSPFSMEIFITQLVALSLPLNLAEGGGGRKKQLCKSIKKGERGGQGSRAYQVPPRHPTNPESPVGFFLI